ncbi:MAG: 50S ribosomal protein L25/general stress protein Ctc [Gammaproteobacteria bacterium]|nr:50S ribosomal protein L25/general stress protein Ctc [Gammaproteobacteria bacterium]MBU1978894.1 50S ribosomal protein L25/general stress protein Ctc [Gammaproteobacteria bacterium]
MKIEISATARTLQGTGASRRLRRTGRIPAVVYGGEKDAAAIELDHKEVFYKLKNEAFHATILSLNLDGKAEQVLLRDYQMHPFRPVVMHVDFQRVNPKEKIHIKVPLHFANADIAPGVKLSSGIVSHIITEVDVACLPKDLPEFIEVDLANLAAGHSIHLSELKLGKGIELIPLTKGEDLAVATITIPRGAVEAAAAAAEVEVKE